jgi:hypothetical protein
MLGAVVWVHGSLPWFVCVTINEESVSEVCIIWQSCQLYDTLLGNSESSGFSSVLHFTFHRLLGIVIAIEEHPDRL